MKKYFLQNFLPFKINEMLKMETLSPGLSCAVSPNCPTPPPSRPVYLTHACSPLIGRLPQVAVELGRAPQKRSLRASALASSRCDRKTNKKKHPTVMHNDGKTCPNQVQISIFISSWPITCGRIAAIGRDWSQSDVCFFPVHSHLSPLPPQLPHPQALPLKIVSILFF